MKNRHSLITNTSIHLGVKPIELRQQLLIPVKIRRLLLNRLPCYYAFHSSITLTLRLTVHGIGFVQVNSGSFRLPVQDPNALFYVPLNRTLFNGCSAVFRLDHASLKSLLIPTARSPQSPRFAATGSASAVAPSPPGGSAVDLRFHTYRVRQKARCKRIHHWNALEPALERGCILRQKPTRIVAVAPHAVPQRRVLVQLFQKRRGFPIREPDCDSLPFATQSDIPPEMGAS